MRIYQKRILFFIHNNNKCENEEEEEEENSKGILGFYIQNISNYYEDSY